MSTGTRRRAGELAGRPKSLELRVLLGRDVGKDSDHAVDGLATRRAQGARLDGDLRHRSARIAVAAHRALAFLCTHRRVERVRRARAREP
jgi:hypothetical protein